MKKYILTSDEIYKIAKLCYQEQGTIKGIKAEASLAANILETSSKYKKQFGDDIYSFMRNSEWFSRAPYFMDYGTATKEMIEAVKDALVNGNRILPLSINEHDCFSDIISVSNNGISFDKRDRTKYIKDVTLITNRWYSRYTFYCFPDTNSDPFGYTKWIDEKQDETCIYVKVGD